MVSLKPGDRVDVRIRDNVIVKPIEKYDKIKSLEIVSADSFGYYLFVPHYLYLNGSSVADAHRCKKMSINLRFVDEQIIYIVEALIAKSEPQDGMCCGHCQDHVLMAAANQPDGKTFICWACRNNRWR
jgi:hypothetical protein